MAFILSDRVKETTTTTGTGTITLGGTIDASKTFSAAIGDGNSTYYCIESPDGNFEVGIGTYTSSSNTLSRDTVISSTNGGSKISLVGVSNVFCTQPGPKAVFINSVGLVSGVNSSFEGFAFPDGTIQYTSATSGNAPTTMQRQNEGILFNYFVNNAYDETVSLHLENEQFPRFKLGLRDSPDGNSAPTYGYLFGEQGYAGGVADSTSEFFIANNNGFWIKHASQNIANFAQDDGIVFQNVSAASPAFTVKGNAAQAADLQRWSDNASTTLAKVTKEGHISGVQIHTPHILFADGTTQVSAAAVASGDNISIFANDAGYLTSHPSISAASSSNNSNNVFIQDITLDSNGHVTAIGTASAFEDWNINSDDGVPYAITDGNTLQIAGGTNVTTTYNNSTKVLTVNATDTNTTYTAGDGLTLSGTEFSAPDIATASGALRTTITSNTAAIPASGYTISGVLQPQISSNTTAIPASGYVISGVLQPQITSNVSNISTNTTAIPASGYHISGVLQSQIDGLSVGSDSFTSESGVAHSGFFSEELHNISGVGGLIANKSNWDTAYSWGDHSAQSYVNLTFTSGIVANSGYAISGAIQAQLSNISNWDTAYGWGDHSTAGYLTSYTETNNLSSAVTWANVPNANITESSVTQHQAALSITESQISDFGSYLTSETSHADVVVDGDFGSEGLMKRGASGGSYSIVTDNSSNWNTAYSWGDHSTQSYTNLTFVSGIVADSGHALQSQIDNLNHDTLTGFVANEHIDWTADQGSTNIHTGNYDNTTYTAGSGIELQGTEFNVAISGDNILATNTPTNNYVPSYVNGQITWVANAGGGGGGSMSSFIITDGSTPQTIDDGETITFADGTGAQFVTSATNTVTVNSVDSEIVHDNLSGYVANEHIDWTSASAGTIHASNYTNTTYSVGDGGLTTNDFTNADHTKLDGIEASADVTDTANVRGAGALMDDELASIADVKALDQSVISGSSPNFTTANMSDASDKRFMTDAQETKLDGIEAGATADQTDAEIRAAVEAATDSNVFTDADHTKLNGIEDNATADQSASEIKTLLENGIDSVHYVDGSIDNEHLANGAVGTDEIADDAVTADKLADSINSAIAANTAKNTNVSTDLGVTTSTTTVTVTSSDGTDATIPVATTSIGGVMSKALFDKLDGIEANATADQTNAEIRAAVEAATDSNVFTDADHTKLDGIAASANNYTLPEATSTTKGGIELFSDTDQAIAANSVTAATGRTYGIQLNSAGQAVVNVPWTDTQQSTDVTLVTSSHDYLSISTQAITLGPIDLAADVTGTLPVANGGTGLTSIATLLNSNVTATTLGLVIGTDVQAYDAALAAIAGLATTDGGVIVGNGSTFVLETGATLRTSLGVDAAGTDNSTDVTLVTTSHDYLSITNQAITLGQIDIGDDTNLTAGTNITLSGDTLNVDDAFLKNDADDTTTGTVTMANLIVGDAGNIGSASDTDAIAISSGGTVTFSQAHVGARVDKGNNGTAGAGAASVSLDARTSNYFEINMQGPVQIDITNAVLGQRIIVRINQDDSGGGTSPFALTYADTIKWAGGSAPTLTADKADVLGFLCTTASSAFDGFVIGQNI